MLSQRFSIKLYATTKPDANKVLEVFHQWIKVALLSEQLVDVVDYGHVHEGPSVLLVGHESDYALDHGEGRAGLFYQRKRAPLVADALSDGLGRLLAAADALSKEPLLAPLAFDRTEFRLTVLDRLNSPNTQGSFDAQKDGIAKAFERHVGAVTVSREDADSTEPFTVRIRGAR